MMRSNRLWKEWRAGPVADSATLDPNDLLFQGFQKFVRNAEFVRINPRRTDWGDRTWNVEAS